MPPRRTSWQTPELAESPYARAYRVQVERVRSAPRVPEWERIANELRITQERLVQRQINLEAAAAELDVKTDAILEKRRWMLDRVRQS
jgi:multiple sugar transport system substrate-binding protein